MKQRYGLEPLHHAIDRTMYLIGWLEDGAFKDVSLASEYPVTQLLRSPRGRPQQQIKLMSATARDLETAERMLLNDLRSDPFQDWTWVTKMPSFAATMRRRASDRRATAVGASVVSATGPQIHPIPSSWIKRRVMLPELHVMASLMPFDNLTRFMKAIGRRDTVWLYDSPPESWAALGGERGLLLVRGDKVVDQVILLLN